ncbi:MAG: discoidin domain-containing protein [Phycisphaerales bacterium]
MCALSLSAARLAPEKRLSDNALLLLSSTSSYDTPEHHLDLFGEGHKPCAFHTATEDKPWIRIDLGSTHAISRIKLVNRTDGWHNRIQGLEISVSNDGTDWVKVADAPGKQAEWDIQIPPVAGKAPAGRYVRIQLVNKECFHLSRAEVWGQ